MEYKIENDSIEIRFDYSLKDLFRDTFRTARWNPTGKFWYVSNNPGNIQKLDAFLTSIEVQNKLKYLVDADCEGMVEGQLEKINAALHEAKAGLRRTKRTLDEQWIKAFKERVADRQTKFEAISKSASKKLKASTTKYEDIRPTFEAMLEPYSFNGYSVPQVLVQAVELVMLVKVSQPTAETASALKDLVVRLEWLKKVQAEVLKSHMVNFTYLGYPLTAANVFYHMVKTPQEAKDWLFDTALIELPEGEEKLIKLEKLACEAVIGEMKPAKAKFKL